MLLLDVRHVGAALTQRIKGYLGGCHHFVFNRMASAEREVEIVLCQETKTDNSLCHKIRQEMILW